MEITEFVRKSEFEWMLPPTGAMRVPVVIFATEVLLREMDEKVRQQAENVAALPGIQRASFAMPDAHWGYGFPIGGVAAFDADEGGVVSAGGVGFDISCGVRALRTGLRREEIEPSLKRLADELSRAIPAGVGSTGRVHLNLPEMDRMLARGAQWAVRDGYGTEEDLEHTEERGCMEGAEPDQVSPEAKRRQQDEMGTLGSGNHYLEVQEIAEIFDERIAQAYGLRAGEIVVSIHCGSRGLGHQIGTEFLKKMVMAAPGYGLLLPERELASVPVHSPVGRQYLGAMRAGINCALANRQILTFWTRRSFATLFPGVNLTVIYDVSHNTCKVEKHRVDGQVKLLHVHRKGATRAFGPGQPGVPSAWRHIGQPVLIGGSMGTASYILAGTAESEELAFGSAVHGAGRAMSRHQALQQWQGRQIVNELAGRGILIRCRSMRGVAEEAPAAYKDVSAVVHAADQAGLARKVAKLVPVICVKG